MSTQNEKNRVPVGLWLTGGMIAALFLLLGTSGGYEFIRYLNQPARQELACLTSWDETFQPRYSGEVCSILQRGIRMPAPNPAGYGFSLRDVSEPEAPNRDAGAW